MIHGMKTATVRELRTAFPRVESWLAEGENVLITKAGRPVAQLTQPPKAVAKPDFAKRFAHVGKAPVKPRFNFVDILAEDRGE